MRVRIFLIFLACAAMVVFLLSREKAINWAADRMLSSFLIGSKMGEIHYEEAYLQGGKFLIDGICLQEEEQEIVIDCLEASVKVDWSGFILQPHVKLYTPQVILKKKSNKRFDLDLCQWLLPSRFLQLKLDVEQGMLSGVAEDLLFFSFVSGKEKDAIGALSLSFVRDGPPMLCLQAAKKGGALWFAYDFSAHSFDKLLPFLALIDGRFACGWEDLQGSISAHGEFGWDGALREFSADIAANNFAFSNRQWNLRGKAEKLACYLRSGIALQVEKGSLETFDGKRGLSHFAAVFTEEGERNFSYEVSGDVFEEGIFSPLQLKGNGGFSSQEGFWAEGHCALGETELLEADVQLYREEKDLFVVHAQSVKGSAFHLQLYKNWIAPLVVEEGNFSGSMTAWVRNGSLEKLALDDMRLENCKWRYDPLKCEGQRAFAQGSGVWSSQKGLQMLCLEMEGHEVRAFGKKWEETEGFFSVQQGKWQPSWVKSKGKKMCVECHFPCEDSIAEMVLQGGAGEVFSLIAPTSCDQSVQFPVHIFASLEKEKEGFCIAGKLETENQGEIAFGAEVSLDSIGDGWFQAKGITPSFYGMFLPKSGIEGKISLLGKWEKKGQDWEIKGGLESASLLIGQKLAISDFLCDASYHSARNELSLDQGIGKIGNYVLEIPSFTYSAGRMSGACSILDGGNEALCLSWKHEGNHLGTLSFSFLKKIAGDISYKWQNENFSFGLQSNLLSCKGERKNGCWNLWEICYGNFSGEASLTELEEGEWKIDKLLLFPLERKDELLARATAEKMSCSFAEKTVHLNGINFALSDALFAKIPCKPKEAVSGKGSLSFANGTLRGEGVLKSGCFILGGKEWDLSRIAWEFIGSKWNVSCISQLSNIPITAHLSYASPIVHLQLMHEQDRLIADFLISKDEFVCKSIEGKLPGLEAHLQRVSPQALKGLLRIDGRKFASFLPSELKKHVEKWDIGKGYALEGVFRLPCCFEGKIRGENAEIFGYVLRELEAEVKWGVAEIDVLNFWIADPALSFFVPRIRCFKEENWLLDIPHLEAKDFRPSALKRVGRVSSPTSFTIAELEFNGVQGYLNRMATLSGRGVLRFKNIEKKGSNFFDIPLDIIKDIGIDPSLLHPAEGLMDLQLEGDKIYVNALRDAFNDGQRCQFYLSDEIEPCYFDLSGNLHIDLKMRQEALLKFAEPFILSIRGTFDKPRYTLR